jgi:hypothetical protein
MNRAVGGVAVLAGAAAGGVAVRRIRSARQERGAARERRLSRWHVVTIYRPMGEVAPGGRPPDPIVELGDRVEVRVRPAPANRGTELGVRLRAPEPSGMPGVAARLSRKDPRYAVRRALRHAKQLLETGEVLRPDWPPSNKPTLTGLPIDAMIRRGEEEGLL